MSAKFDPDEAATKAEELVRDTVDQHSPLLTAERAPLVEAVTADLQGQHRRLLDFNKPLEAEYRSLPRTPDNLTAHMALIEKLRTQNEYLQRYIAWFVPVPPLHRRRGEINGPSRAPQKPRPEVKLHTSEKR